MKIVVTHLTRMQAPFICVAGIDLDTGRHVRPVLEYERLGRSLLARHGGPFDIGAIVDLGATRSVGRAPEIEDWRFDRKKARRLGSLPLNEIWRHLSLASCTRLADIFGDDLYHYGATYVVDPHKGSASLGCLQPVKAPELVVNTFGKIRLHLCNDTHSVWLPVTDLRLYEDDQATPRQADVERLAEQIANGARVMLCMGLTRPYLKPGDAAEHHWLQVNNIHVRGTVPHHNAAKQTGVDNGARCMVRNASAVHEMPNTFPTLPDGIERETGSSVDRQDSLTEDEAQSLHASVERNNLGARHGKGNDLVETPFLAGREAEAQANPRVGQAIMWSEVDHAVQQAIMVCCNTLPVEERSAERIEEEIVTRVRSSLGLPRPKKSPPKSERSARWEAQLTKMRGEHAKAYMPWTPEDDFLLRQQFADGASVDRLTLLLERHPGAISARLNKLGLVE